MFAERFPRITVWTLGSLILLALAAFLWLRESPYWAGIALFAEDYRVENFRNMERVFPARTVARSGPVWELDHDPQRLPQTYMLDGAEHDLEPDAQ